MSLGLPRWEIIVLLACFSGNTVWSTSHVWLRNDDGVWLASDTFLVHHDNAGVSAHTTCKVVISRNRLIFNMGSLLDIKRLVTEERQLPPAPIARLKRPLASLLLSNHQDVTKNPGYSRDKFYYFAGVIQVEFGTFREFLIYQADDHTKDFDDYLNEFRLGIPHGLDPGTVRDHNLSAADKSISQQFSQQPKVELLKLLRLEVKRRPDEVQPPFTVLLLHNDGSVQDFSDQKVCEIPADAKYVDKSNNQAVH